MGWTLRIYTPTGGPHVSGSLIAEYTENSPGGIVGGFRWSRAPHGDCLQMEFAAVPKLVGIPPRAIVHFLVNGQSAFYGFVARAWPAYDGAARGYLVVGASQLLRHRVVRAAYTTLMGTGVIVRNLISQFAHPAIRYDPAHVSDTGYALSSLKVQWVDLHQVLTDLASATPGVSWGVDADGHIYFRAVSTVTSVRYEDGIREPLPIEALEVWDEVILIAPRELGIGEFTYNTGAGYGSQRVFLVGPELITDYAIYSTDEVYIAPSPLCTTNRGVNWFSCTKEQARAYMDDHNPDTGIRPTWSIVRQYSTPTRAPAVYLDAVVLNGCGLIAAAYLASGGSEILSLGNSYRGWVSWPTRVRDGAVTRVIIQPNYCYGTGASPSNDYALYEVGFSYWDAFAATRVAQALARAPYLSPSQVEVDGYVPPATTLVLLGAPGGDVRGPVAEVEYEYSVERGLRSLIRIGTTGGRADPAGHAIRIAASLLDQGVEQRLRRYIG